MRQIIRETPEPERILADIQETMAEAKRLMTEYESFTGRQTGLSDKLDELSNDVERERPLYVNGSFSDPVIRFINEFRANLPVIEQETIRKQFRSGYCYYFAKMLQAAFPKGEPVWCAPFGHIAYRYDGRVYDVDGVYDGNRKDNPDFFVPLRYIGDYLKCFLHDGSETAECIPSHEDLCAMVEAYRTDRKKQAESMVSAITDENLESFHECTLDEWYKSCVAWDLPDGTLTAMEKADKLACIRNALATPDWKAGSYEFTEIRL